MPNRGTNASKITISLKKREREALAKAAEAEGVSVPTLCAEIIRRHMTKRGSITEEERKKAV